MHRLSHPHLRRAARRATSGQTARLSGWVHRKRDHGQLLFIDLRDHYGLTQCVVDAGNAASSRRPTALRLESVVTVTGEVVRAGRRRRSTRSCRPARSSWPWTSSRVQSAGRAAAAPGQQRRRLPRGDAPALPLPRPAPRAAAPQHPAALPGHRQHPPPHDRGRLHRVPDADPDRRARPEGARDYLVPEPHPSRASSTRCRRRRSSSSSC